MGDAYSILLLTTAPRFGISLPIASADSETRWEAYWTCSVNESRESS